MKRPFGLLVSFSLLLLIFSTCAVARDDGESSVSLNLEAAALNKYVWRGMILTDGPVFQPAVTLGFSGLSLGLWVNLELNDVNDNRFHITEVDYDARYSFSFDKLSANIGIIRYTFPNTDLGSTTEIYAGIGLDTVLQPSITIYRDIDLIDGTYISFAGSQSLALGRSGHSLGLSAALGYGSSEHNLFYYGVDESCLTDLLLSAVLSLKLGDNLTLSPQIAYSAFMSDKIKDNFDYDHATIFGVGVAVDF
jgi:hypothetical protein